MRKETFEYTAHRQRVEGYNSHANLLLNNCGYLEFGRFWETYKTACENSGLNFGHLEIKGEHTGRGLGKRHIFIASRKKGIFKTVAETSLYDSCIGPHGFSDIVYLYCPWSLSNKIVSDRDISSLRGKDLRALIIEFYRELNQKGNTK